MHRSLARYSAPVSLVHAPSWADFITAMVGFKVFGTHRHCKYARQNGIHVSPTFMIDGLVQADMSSGDAISDWVLRLRKS